MGCGLTSGEDVVRPDGTPGLAEQTKEPKQTKAPKQYTTLSHGLGADLYRDQERSHFNDSDWRVDPRWIAVVIPAVFSTEVRRLTTLFTGRQSGP